MVRKCSEPTPFAACSADDDDGSGDYNGVSGGGVVVSKKKVSFSRGDNCLPQFCENSNSTAITELTTAGVRRNITIYNSYVCDSKIWIQIFNRRKKNVTHTATLNSHKNRLPDHLTTNPNAAASTRRIDGARTRDAIENYRQIKRFA